MLHQFNNMIAYRRKYFGKKCFPILHVRAYDMIGVATKSGTNTFSVRWLRLAHFFDLGCEKMSVYKKMYLGLFNAVTDALEKDDVDEIIEMLKQAQIDAEEIYINSTEETE